MKRRIDYEREPAQRVDLYGAKAEFIPVSIARIGTFQPTEESPDGGVFIHLDAGLPLPIGVELADREELDKIIAAIIKARNEVWPQA
jgi:hypothetical protein